MEKKVTFVKYFFPGFLFAETSTKKISSRGAPVHPPKGCYAFQFYDSVETTADGETLYTSPKNLSGLFFVSGIVYTLEEVKSSFPSEKILISNMECNDYKKVIKCKTGNWMPFEKNDVLLKSSYAD